ncbi:outer membrane protein assembly factor BamA [Larkinella insperata]|uniref:Outer membrane protein assembly factor BamA n=1 Tax=Larkinella insperata TaxID=332158 RepID=A0ABW3QDD2_9BACT|nr:outer membrane protein assembly factor BamA [Larkinella insperata]
MKSTPTTLVSLKHKILLAAVGSLMLLAGLPAQAQIRPGFGGGRITTSPSTETASPINLNYADPKEYEIAGLTVTGNKYLDPNSLLSLTGLKVGDKIRVPGESINSAIKRLMGQGLLEDVEILATKVEGDQISLNVSIKEQPRLYKVTFVGIKKSEQDALKDKVKLNLGRLISNTLIKNTQLSVKKYFVEKGFLNTKVKIISVPTDSTRNQATMRVSIDKGSKVKINNIEIRGRELVEESKIRLKMKGTKQMRFGRLFTPSKFVPKKFEEDKQKVVEYYNKEGYRDATITFDSVYAHDGRTVNIVMNIDEGQKYYVRNVSWEGNYLYTDEQLTQVLGLKKGDLYSKEDIEKRKNGIPGSDLSSAYMDRGYLYFNAEDVIKSVEGDSLDLEFRIFEGKQATINRIILNGNTKTSDHVVLREIRTLPGQKFSKTDIIRTQRELATLGYFDPEKIGINPVPQPDGTVDIEYTVEEKPSDQIELSGGWGGYVGFVGTLGLVFNNFSARNITNMKAWRPLPAGDGQKVALRFQANGRQFQTYSLTFTEPWLGGRKPNALSVSLSRTIYRLSDYSLLYSNPTAYGKNFYGSYGNTMISLGLGKRLRFPDDFFQLSNSLTYQRYELNNYDIFQIGLRDGTSNSITFNTTLARNSIDNPQFPRSGSSISLLATLTPPYSAFSNKTTNTNVDVRDRYKWVEYHKWMFDASWFATVTGKLVLNARAHMGFLGRYNSRTEFSPFERFVLGGSGLAGTGQFALAQDIIGLRGYNDRDVYTGINGISPTQQERARGGLAFSKYIMELRYPVSLNPSATIFVLGFLEAGNNWGNFKNYNPFDLKRSAGFGARIFMPAFGLIGIDYGYGFDRMPGSPTRPGPGGQFHFTIGQQIR